MQLEESFIIVSKVVIFLLLLLIIFGQTYFNTQINDYKTYLILLFLFINISTLFISFTKKLTLSLVFSALGIITTSLLYLENMILFPVLIILCLCYTILFIISLWVHYK